MAEDHPFVDDMPEEEPRDYTKFLWLGVIALVAIMLGALAFSSSQVSGNSTVRARHILVMFQAGDPTDRTRALDLISSLREDLLNGADFASLAQDYSDDPGSGARGGDLGYHERGVFEPAFEEYVWKSEIGEISDVIETNFGFHIIEVIDRKISDADLYEKQVEEEALRRLEEQRSGGGQ